jgi:hypothetical protein
MRKKNNSDMNRKPCSLVLAVKAKGRLEAVDRFLDILQQAPDVELHGDYARIKTDDSRGVNYSSSFIVVVKPETGANHHSVMEMSHSKDGE